MAGPVIHSVHHAIRKVSPEATAILSPSAIITQVETLQPGQWFTLQAFVLVTGTSPTYTQNGTRWDCTSPDPTLHWTDDEERYCYSDYQTIVNALATYNANLPPPAPHQ